ncbi:hypothetical protein lerEdw1_006124, partial [Lerista edwardsae]
MKGCTLKSRKGFSLGRRAGKLQPSRSTPREQNIPCLCTLHFVPGEETCGTAIQLWRNSAPRKAPSITRASRSPLFRRRENPAPEKSREMEQRSGSQLLLSFILLGVFCSEVLALPPYSSMRNTRHADGLFTSAYSKLLGEQSARRYLESLIGKRVGSDTNLIDEQEPVKRHIDAVFTSLYGRARARQKLANYVRAVLAENE